MEYINPLLIKNALSDLRNLKTNAFMQKDGLFDFMNVIEACRFYDVVMLPLLYIWEHNCQRELSAVTIEDNLIKPYRKFVMDPYANTMELYLLLKTGEPTFLPKRCREKLLDIYKTVLQ